MRKRLAIVVTILLGWVVATHIAPPARRSERYGMTVRQTSVGTRWP